MKGKITHPRLGRRESAARSPSSKKGVFSKQKFGRGDSSGRDLAGKNPAPTSAWRKERGPYLSPLHVYLYQHIEACALFALYFADGQEML